MSEQLRTMRGQVTLAGLLCIQTHPLALMLGTVGPWDRCCPDCRMVPPGPPTSWTFPA
jgi:hypothetical protein